MSYYNILNVDSLSSMDDIEVAYKKYINTTLLSDEIKREIEKAYQTLSNYHSRRMYDNQSENSNLVKDITASNEETGNEFFLNKDTDDFCQLNNDDIYSNNNYPNSNLYSNRSFSENFENQMIHLNRRLEQIEQKLDTDNKTNFYREKKVIIESIKNGNKIITIEYNINDNGHKTKSTKVIEYNDEGKKNIYFLKNKSYNKNNYNSNSNSNSNINTNINSNSNIDI